MIYATRHQLLKAFYLADRIISAIKYVYKHIRDRINITNKTHETYNEIIYTINNNIFNYF